MFSRSDLEAWFDELLPQEEMARIEAALRTDAALREQAARVQSRRAGGAFSLGAVWRASGASCPSRDRLGSFLLGALDAAEADAIEFHLHEIGCRYCQANLADLESRQAEAPAAAATRRRKYFQSSAGYLKRNG